MRSQHRVRTPHDHRDDRRRGPRAFRRRTGLALLAAALLSLPGVTGGLAGADPEASIEDKRAEAAEISDRLAELDMELSRLAEEANEAQVLLEQAESDMAAAQERVAATRAELAARESDMRGYAVDAYVGGNSGESISVLMSASTDDASRKRGYLTAASDAKRDLIDELTTAEAALEAEILSLADAKADAAANAAELAEATAGAEAAVAEQEAIAARIDDELAGLIAEEEARRAAAAAEAAEARARLASFETTTAAEGGGTTGAAGSAADEDTAPEESTSSTTAAPSGPAPSNPAPTAPAPTNPAPTNPAPTNPAPTTPTTAAPAPPPPPPPPPAPTSGAQAAIAAARSMLGVQYVWGGASPSGGFDCSGLTMWAWAKGGKSLPHSSRMQYSMTQRIPMSQIQPGDLIFYGRPSVHHVALYIGNGQIIHAPNSRSVVRVDSVYYWSALVGAGRIR